MSYYPNSSSNTPSSQQNNRKRIALERSRERRFHDEIERLEQHHDPPRAVSASTSFPSHKIYIPDHRRGESHESNQGANYSSSSAPRSENGGSVSHYPHREPSPPNRGTAASMNNPSNFYQRSPLEFQGQHISFLPPHVIESLRPYYKNAADGLKQHGSSSNYANNNNNDEKQLQDGGGRPRPPSFVFAPKYIDSGNVPSNYVKDGITGPIPHQQQHFSPPASSAYDTYMNSQVRGGTNSNQQQQQRDQLMMTMMMKNGNNSRISGNGNNVTSGTQTTYDPNASVSYVDISASNAVLQRRVERLEQQLEESIEQKEKLNHVIKTMSYAIVPPLAFLPREFYEKNRSVIDTCSDYAMLYRTALRATPAVGGDLDAFEKKLEEQSKEHLMDRVVCLTSEVMNLRKLVADMERVNAMSP